jgi:hypothetical protein
VVGFEVLGIVAELLVVVVVVAAAAEVVVVVVAVELEPVVKFVLGVEIFN